MENEDYTPPEKDLEHMPHRPGKAFIPHYYGNLIRRLFLICGFIMLVTLPFLQTKTSTPVFFSIIGILLLAFFAGMTNPHIKWVIGADIIISFVGFLVFGYQAFSKFAGVRDLFSATNFALAIIFLFAFYYSIKTLRGIQFPEKISMFKEIRESSENIIPPAEIPSQKSHLTDEERRIERFKSDEAS